MQTCSLLSLATAVPPLGIAHTEAHARTDECIRDPRKQRKQCGDWSSRCRIPMRDVSSDGGRQQSRHRRLQQRGAQSCDRGEHNAEVLEAWAGYTADDIASLTASGVLIAEDRPAP